MEDFIIEYIKNILIITACYFFINLKYYYTLLKSIINYLIFLNFPAHFHENESRQISYSNSTENRDYTKLKEDIEILKMKNANLEKSYEELKLDNMNIQVQQNILIKEQEKNNNKSILIEKSVNLRNNFLLISFANQVQTLTAFVRMVSFRKITNCLIDNIIEKNKKYLKRTNPIFLDVLKPKINQKKFFVILYANNDIDESKKKEINISLDFLMFIHDYTSSKIHLNKIENYNEIVEEIRKNSNEDLQYSEENISENKTDSSFRPNELVDYVFNRFDIIKQINEIIAKIEKEDSDDDSIDKNNLIVLRQSNEEPDKIDYEQQLDLSGKEKKNKEKNNEKLNEGGDRGENFSGDNVQNKQEKDNNKIKDGNINIGNNEYNQSSSKINGKINNDKDIRIKINYSINQRAIDNNVNENKNMTEKNKNFVDDEKKQLFDKYVKKYAPNVDGNNLDLIKTILFQNNEKNVDLSNLFNNINENSAIISKLQKKINSYKNKIDNFNFDYPEEFSIEKMFNIYVLQFDEKSAIYDNYRDILYRHYRFQQSYKKIIDKKDISKINLNIIKENIKSLSGNNLIDILSEDKGRFGFDLDIDETFA